MSVHTRSQKLAQAAYRCASDRKQKLDAKKYDDYKSFAKKFPALIHTCGLAQAVSFSLAKQETDYVADLASVLNAAGHPEISDAQSLDDRSRKEQLGGYLRLSRDAINAASWLKRYAEAVGEDD